MGKVKDNEAYVWRITITRSDVLHACDVAEALSQYYIKYPGGIVGDGRAQCQHSDILLSVVGCDIWCGFVKLSSFLRVVHIKLEIDSMDCKSELLENLYTYFLANDAEWFAKVLNWFALPAVVNEVASANDAKPFEEVLNWSQEIIGADVDNPYDVGVNRNIVAENLKKRQGFANNVAT
ncbi:hypothetical protein Tco_0816398 [Tanacetum coccineum]